MPSTTESPLQQQQQQQQQNEPPQDLESIHRLPINTYHCRFCSHLLLATTRDLDSLPRRRRLDDDTTLSAAFGSKNGNDIGMGMRTGATETATGGIDSAIILPLPGKRSEGGTTTTSAEEEEEEEEEEDQDNNNNNNISDYDSNNNNNNDDGDDKNETEINQQQRHQPKQKEKTKINHITILLSTVIPSFPKSLIRRADGFEKRLCLRCGRCRVVMGYFLDPVHFPDWTPSAAKVAGGQSAGGRNGNEDKDTQGDDGNVNANSNEPKVVYILPGSLVETNVLADGDDEKVGAKDGEWKAWFQG